MKPDEYNKEITNRMLVVEREFLGLNKIVREINQEKISLTTDIENVYDEERGMRIYNIMQKDEALNNESRRLNQLKIGLDLKILETQQATHPNFASLEQLVLLAEENLKKQKLIVENLVSGIIEIKKILGT